MLYEKDEEYKRDVKIKILEAENKINEILGELSFNIALTVLIGTIARGLISNSDDEAELLDAICEFQIVFFKTVIGQIELDNIENEKEKSTTH